MTLNQEKTNARFYLIEPINNDVKMFSCKEGEDAFL